MVHKLETKSHDTPDEKRTPDKTRVDVVRLEETCQAAHVGYAVSGSITVKMNDGSQTTILPGMSYAIPPGHDAWVEGKEPFVAIEVMSAEQYAKPA
jgi:hypothetical protein